LAQEALMEDYLHPFEAQIANCSSDFVVRQVMIWAILHYVLLRQRPKYRAHVVFYESLRVSPEREVSKLFQFLQGDSFGTGTPAALLDVVNRPSRMTRINADQADQRCSPGQMSEIADILATFELDDLYDSDRRLTETAAKQAD
jgi:hypothetical protein